MSKTMTRTQVYIPTELYEQAKFFAKTQNKSISEFMREGLKEAMRKQAEKPKTKRHPFDHLVGKFRCPEDNNIAGNHNDIYSI